MPRSSLGPNPINRGQRGDFGGAPIALSDSLTLAAVNANAVFDTQTLQPGFRTPYMIDEIRMAAGIRTPPGSTGQTFNVLDFLSSVQFKFSTGRYAFSRDFIPMVLHAPRFGQNVLAVSNSTTAYMTYEVRWLLPKPLYLEAGDVVNAMVRQVDGNPATGNVVSNIPTCWVTYIGRTLPPGTPAPLTRNVPWLASFNNKLTANGQVFQTNDEFRNPFMDDLWVQRFTAHIDIAKPSLINGATGPESTSADTPPSGWYPTALQAGSIGWAEVRMYDSQGYAIVPNYTPWNDVFDGTRRAWTFSRSLAPREQFDVQVRASLTGTIGTYDTSKRIDTFLGMVGYREENVP